MGAKRLKSCEYDRNNAKQKNISKFILYKEINKFEKNIQKIKKYQV